MSKKAEREAAIKAQQEREESAKNPKHSEGLKDLTVASNCPVRFVHKGDEYDIRTISRSKARKLAEDEDFEYINKKKASAAPSSSASNK